MSIRQTGSEKAHDEQCNDVKTYYLNRFPRVLSRAKAVDYPVFCKKRQRNKKQRAERRDEKRRRGPYEETRDAYHHDVQRYVRRRQVACPPDQPSDEQRIEKELAADLPYEI